MSLSLSKSITTCKVDTSQTNRMQSDRFLSTDNLICSTWNGMDSVGRFVSENTYNSMTAGCQPASKRVDVENELRPKYFEHVNLSSLGMQGSIYGSNQPFQSLKAQKSSDYIHNIESNNPNFGSQFQSTNRPSCGGLDNYEKAMAQMSQQNRASNFAYSSYNSNQNKNISGII